MSEPLQIQIRLNALSERVFRALTDDLSEWFAEHSDVQLVDNRYDFWGRYTPEAPDRDGGRHPLVEVRPGQRFAYNWTLRNEQTTVRFDLINRHGQTALILRQNGSSGSHSMGEYTFEDFWFLSLENLRRHLDGKRPVRCDFSTLPMTGDVQHTVDIDAPRSVVFETLIKPEQLNRWIASKAVIEPRMGGDFDLGWGVGTPLKILELLPDEKLSYSWLGEGDNPPTVVTWTLEGSSGQTRLTLVHSGFAPDAPTGGIQAGWLNFSSWVKSLAEYGQGWQPAIKRLNAGTEAFYPASVGAAQSWWQDVDALLATPSSPPASSAKPVLGRHVEVVFTVSDLAAAHAFYQKLGFLEINPQTFSDGGYILRLAQGAEQSMALHYYESDFTSLNGAELTLQSNGASHTFTGIGGLPVNLTADGSPVPPLSGAPMSRQPLSRCGKFGEMALSVTDYAAAAAFWGRLGFAQLHAETGPYPWGIFSDGLMILGLHQTQDFAPPTITYFAGNMAERIAAFQKEGFSIQSVMGDAAETITNAKLTTLDGQNIFLFQGEL